MMDKCCKTCKHWAGSKTANIQPDEHHAACLKRVPEKVGDVSHYTPANGWCSEWEKPDDKPESE